MLAFELITWLATGLIAALFKSYLLDETPPGRVRWRSLLLGTVGALAGGTLGSLLVGGRAAWTGSSVVALLFAVGGAIALLVLEPSSKTTGGHGHRSAA